jgi:hypothetical protein
MEQSPLLVLPAYPLRIMHNPLGYGGDSGNKLAKYKGQPRLKHPKLTVFLIICFSS